MGPTDVGSADRVSYIEVRLKPGVLGPGLLSQILCTDPTEGRDHSFGVIPVSWHDVPRPHSSGVILELQDKVAISGRRCGKWIPTPPREHSFGAVGSLGTEPSEWC